jgi:hypothetical protein
MIRRRFMFAAIALLGLLLPSVVALLGSVPLGRGRISLSLLGESFSPASLDDPASSVHTPYEEPSHLSPVDMLGYYRVWWAVVLVPWLLLALKVGMAWVLLAFLLCPSAHRTEQTRKRRLRWVAALSIALGTLAAWPWIRLDCDLVRYPPGERLYPGPYDDWGD